MNILFENKYYSNDEMLAEYINKVILKDFKIKGIVVLLGGVFLLFMSLMQNDKIWTGVAVASLFIVVMVLIFTPSMTLKQLKESDKKIHRAKRPQTKVQFGDKIYLSEGTFSLTIEYDQIIKQYDLNHSYALMFGKKNGILVEPGSFVRGNFEDFKEFIKDKTK